MKISKIAFNTVFSSWSITGKCVTSEEAYFEGGLWFQLDRYTTFLNKGQILFEQTSYINVQPLTSIEQKLAEICSSNEVPKSLVLAPDQ